VGLASGGWGKAAREKTALEGTYGEFFLSFLLTS
jgi:hypothetical protein